MIARLSARAERLVSRLVQTTEPFFERGAVRHRETDRDLRGDVDVREAAHAAAAEERAGAARLPHDRRGDERAGIDRLERVDLHRRVDDRLVTDERLVADHDAFLDAHAVADVARAPEHRAAHARAGSEVHVVVHDRAFDARVRLHDDVVAEHGVGTQHRAGLDAAVVADQHRTLDHDVG